MIKWLKKMFLSILMTKTAPTNYENPSLSSFKYKLKNMDEERRVYWKRQIEAMKDMEQVWDLGGSASTEGFITTDSDVNREKKMRKVKKKKFTKTRVTRSGEHQVYDSDLGTWIMLAALSSDDYYDDSSRYDSSGPCNSYDSSSSYSSSSSSDSYSSSSSSSCDSGSSSSCDF